MIHSREITITNEQDLYYGGASRESSVEEVSRGSSERPLVQKVRQERGFVLKDSLSTSKRLQSVLAKQVPTESFEQSTLGSRNMSVMESGYHSPRGGSKTLKLRVLGLANDVRRLRTRWEEEVVGMEQRGDMRGKLRLARETLGELWASKYFRAMLPSAAL